MNINELKQIYERMLRIRLVEEKIAEKYSEQKMRCPTHLSIGQESVAAVVGFLMRKDDFFVSSHRAHGHYLGKNGNLKKMIAEIYGKETGCSKGRGGSMHLIDKSVGFYGSTAIVGGTIPIGVGLGLSFKLKNTDQISCIFFGDGAIEEGVFYESINFAMLKYLPVLFICENNLYSVYSSLKERQPEGRQIHKMVEGLGCKVFYEDGNDPIKVYNTIKEAEDYIRKGNGPVFIEYFTYRWREHCGPNYDNDLGYRSISEFEEWKKKDPMIIIKEKLTAIDDSFFTEIEKLIKNEIDKAFIFAEKSPFPEEDSLMNFRYSSE